jgi:putative oxidoreductase
MTILAAPMAAARPASPGGNYLSAGLLILRIVVGGLVAAHGLQKTTRLLGGAGLAGGAEEFRRDGFRDGQLTALAAAGTQTGGGVLLAAGLLIPLAVAAVAGVMTVAAAVKRPNGLWAQHDGYEYPLVLILAAAVIGLTGPGLWSLDQLAGISWPAPAGLAGCAAGVLAGLGTLWWLRSGQPTGEGGPP